MSASEKQANKDTQSSLESASSAIVSTMPRLYKALMRQARDSEPLRGVPLEETGDAQLWTLHALLRGPQVSSELARRSNVTNPTMTRVVEALVEKGYVNRCPDPDDRRRVNLSLTEAGADLAARISESYKGALISILGPLSAGQLDEVTRAFGYLASLPSVGGYACNADSRTVSK